MPGKEGGSSGGAGEVRTKGTRYTEREGRQRSDPLADSQRAKRMATHTVENTCSPPVTWFEAIESRLQQRTRSLYLILNAFNLLSALASVARRILAGARQQQQ